MTVVSSKEFATNQTKYYNLAVNKDVVVIKRGKNIFHLIYTDTNNTSEYDQILEPDDDFRRAITMDELRKKVKEDIHQWYSERNECNSITGGTAVS